MTGLQRALNTISSQKTDRPSVLPSIDVAYAPTLTNLKIGECFKNTALHAKALMTALDTFPEIDGLYINLCLFEETLKAEGGLLNDGHGLKWYVPENDIGTAKIHEIEELTDKRIEEETSLKYGIIETFKKIEPEYKENFLLLPGITGPYSQIVFMLGLENTLMLMFDEPEELKAAIEKRVKYAVNWLHELKDAGAKGVWLGEGAASSSVISPKAYGEFVAPYAKAVIDEAKKLGLPCFMHVCGDIRPSLKEIFSTGTTEIDIDHMVPLTDARAAADKKICLKGNMDPVFLLKETKEAVLQKSKEILLSVDSPLILGTGCLVAPGTPKENIEAMVEASKALA